MGNYLHVRIAICKPCLPSTWAGLTVSTDIYNSHPWTLTYLILNRNKQQIRFLSPKTAHQATLTNKFIKIICEWREKIDDGFCRLKGPKQHKWETQFYYSQRCHTIIFQGLAWRTFSYRISNSNLAEKMSWQKNYNKNLLPAVFCLMSLN